MAGRLVGKRSSWERWAHSSHCARKTTAFVHFPRSGLFNIPIDNIPARKTVNYFIEIGLTAADTYNLAVLI